MNYITCWDVSLATQARLVAVVLGALPGATLKAVWATSREEIISGTPEDFTGIMPLPFEGFFHTEWVPISDEAIDTGDVYVGIVLNAATDIRTLIFGTVEVQIR